MAFPRQSSHRSSQVHQYCFSWCCEITLGWVLIDTKTEMSDRGHTQSPQVGFFEGSQQAISSDRGYTQSPQAMVFEGSRQAISSHRHNTQSPPQRPGSAPATKDTTEFAETIRNVEDQIRSSVDGIFKSQTATYTSRLSVLTELAEPAQVSHLSRQNTLICRGHHDSAMDS